MIECHSNEIVAPFRSYACLWYSRPYSKL